METVTGSSAEQIDPAAFGEPFRLHIGGDQATDGWVIFDITDRPEVDIVGNVVDLGAIPTDSVDEIYAAHVFEHLGYQNELRRALAECRRVLKNGGKLKMSVPDIRVLGSLLNEPDLSDGELVWLMRILYGGQSDQYDFHKTGFTWEILAGLAAESGFEHLGVVERFGLFDDCSEIRVRGRLVSLNVELW